MKVDMHTKGAGTLKNLSQFSTSASVSKGQLANSGITCTFTWPMRKLKASTMLVLILVLINWDAVGDNTHGAVPDDPYPNYADADLVDANDDVNGHVNGHADDGDGDPIDETDGAGANFNDDNDVTANDDDDANTDGAIDDYGADVFDDGGAEIIVDAASYLY